MPDSTCPKCEHRSDEEWRTVYGHWLAARNKLAASPPPLSPIGQSKSSLSRNKAAWARHRAKLDKLDVLVSVTNPCLSSSQDLILSAPWAQPNRVSSSFVFVAAGPSVHRAGTNEDLVSLQSGFDLDCAVTRGSFSPSLNSVFTWKNKSLVSLGTRRPQPRGSAFPPVPGPGSRVPCSVSRLGHVPLFHGFRVPGSMFRVPGSVFRVPGSGFRVPYPMFRVPCAVFQDLMGFLSVRLAIHFPVGPAPWVFCRVTVTVFRRFPMHVLRPRFTRGRSWAHGFLALVTLPCLPHLKGSFRIFPCVISLSFLVQFLYLISYLIGTALNFWVFLLLVKKFSKYLMLVLTHMLLISRRLVPLRLLPLLPKLWTSCRSLPLQVLRPTHFLQSA